MLQNTEGRVYFWSPTTISKSSQKKKKEHLFVTFMWMVKKRAVSFSQKRKLSTKEKTDNLWLALTVHISQENLHIMNLHEWTPCIQYFNTPKKPLFFWPLHFFCLPTASQPCFFAKWGCESRNFPAFPVKLTGFQRCLPPIIRCSL